jgi:hypothetical protein
MWFDVLVIYNRGLMDIQDIATDLVLKHEEKTFFTCEEVIVTDLRILVKPRKKYLLDNDVNNWNYLNTDECILPKSKNGGKVSRKELAHKLIGMALAMIGFQVIPFLLFNINVIDLFGVLANFVEAFYFLTTMLAFSGGIYFLIITYMYSDPHTSLLFSSLSSKRNLVAIFPGWDNDKAEKTISAIRRAQRKI